MQRERRWAGSAFAVSYSWQAILRSGNSPAKVGCPGVRHELGWLPVRSSLPTLVSALHPQSAKHFVYVLRNQEAPPRYYTGITSDAPTRLSEHNRGRCTHTAKYGPWSIDV